LKHELKILPQYYCRVADGTKTFEVRVNDRGFQPGDIVILHEWDEKHVSYTDSKGLRFKVGYVLPIDDKRVVFSLLPINEAFDKGSNEHE